VSFTIPDGAGLMEAAAVALPEQTAELLRRLHEFTLERLEAASLCRTSMVTALQAGGVVGIGLHSFLRECWAVLDGLAREVNVCMEHLFPDAGLYPPRAMTRQCTFYVLRQKLHEHPSTAGHSVSRMLWERTRETPPVPYVRLSFLHNLSLFLPLSQLPEADRLPGSRDAPDVAQDAIRSVEVPRCGLQEGTQEILDWLAEVLGECYGRLEAALRDSIR
jgi:hypothetical protein